MRHLSFLKYLLPICMVPFGVVANAQNSLSYLNDTGSPAYSVTIPVENGYIDVSNGNLHLEFPLASPPQRGALKLSERLVYDSRIWMFSPFGGNGSYHWWPYNVYGTSTSSGGWRLVTGAETGEIGQGGLVSANYGECFYDPMDPQDAGQDNFLTWDITWTDPSGTVHPFSATETEEFNSCDGSDPTTSSAGSATDGSGYQANTDGNGNFTIIDNTGTQVYPQIIDRYGNYWSSDSSGNLIDDTGRTPVIATQNGNTTYYDVLAPNGIINNNGVRVRYTVVTAPVPVATEFNESDVHEWVSSNDLNPVQSITLPDGSSYTFGYESTPPSDKVSSKSYGELTSVTLPTGGVIHYSYGNFQDSSSTMNRWLASRTVGTNSPMLFTPSVITTCANYSTGCVEQVNVHKPSGDETVYQLTLINGAWNTGTTVYTGTASSGTPLVQTTSTNKYSNGCSSMSDCVGANFLARSLESTQIFGNGTSISSQVLSSFNQYTGSPTSVKEWNFVSGAPNTSAAPSTTPTRETDYVYGGWNDIQSTTVLDSNGNKAGQTSYGYTWSATPTSGISQHGTQNAGGPYLQTITHWLNGGTSPVTTLTMDDTGQVIGAQDPANNSSTTTYQCSNSLPLQVTNALSQTAVYGYDCNSGALLSAKDPNDIANSRVGTTYAYEPLAGRLQSITYPDTGSTTYSYPSPIEIDTTVAASPDPSISSADVLDSYGRAYQHIQNGVSSETTYDINGRVSCGTNLHTFSSSPTGSICITAYDGLDRPLTQQQQDGNTVQASYVLNFTNTTDEAGNQIQRKSDAFGHLAGVWEVQGSSTALVSNYTYDGLGNLYQITQLGNGSSDVPRVRTFAHDSLSRLISTVNPESGNTTYSYLKSGVLCAGDVSLPCSKTDARGITISYAYDALNRLTGKSYSDGTPAVSFGYDQSGQFGVGCNGTTASASQCNTVGRLSLSSVNNVISIYGYDAMGRKTFKSTCLGSLCGSDRIDQYFTYDLAGDLTSYDHGTDIARGAFYGSHALSYDAAGRLNGASAQGLSASSPLFSATSFGPTGLLNSTLGNGFTETRAYDIRGRQISYNVVNPPLTSISSSLTGAIDGFQNADFVGPGVPTNVGIPQEGVLDVGGWAATNTSCPVAGVEIDLDQTFIGYGSVGSARPDVQAFFGGGSQYADCGYSFSGSVGSIAPGVHTLHAYAIDESGNRQPLPISSAIPQTVTISQNPPPFGVFDGYSNPFDGSQNFLPGSRISVRGWAVDNQLQAPVGAVRILIDGNPIGYATLGVQRQDVANAYNNPLYLPSGWQFTGSIGNVAPGQHTVSAMIYDSGGQKQLAGNVYTFTVQSEASTVSGFVDGAVVNSSRTLTAAGWAAEPGTANCSDVSSVEILLDGWKIGTAGSTMQYRDLDATYPGQGCVNVEWSFSGSLPAKTLPGVHTITARAYDHLGGSVVLLESAYQNNIVTVPGNVNPTSAASTLPSQYAWALGYAPNGNVDNAYDSVNGNYAYLYDNLNRLVASGSAGGNGLQWSYDSFGNMLSQAVTGGMGTTKQFVFTGGSNQEIGACYDAAGNQQDDFGCGETGVHEYVYDAESRVASANGIGYLYDGEGNRAAKFTNGQFTNYYLYDLSGHIVTELDSNFNPLRREAYAGGRHLGTYTGTGPLLNDTTNVSPAPFTYGLADWLGTERARADASGNLCETTTSQPFGDNAQTTGTCDPTLSFFTGLERDQESGLDHAIFRQYSSTMGRWMSPDPYDGSMDIGNPQSLNRYSYVGNNPLGFVDPSGLVEAGDGSGGGGWQQTVVYIAEATVVGAIADGIYDGVSDIIGLFGHATLKGSATPRPPWDPHNAHLGIPNIASVLGLPGGCEFGVCGIGGDLQNAGTMTLPALPALPELIAACVAAEPCPWIVAGTAAIGTAIYMGRKQSNEWTDKARLAAPLDPCTWLRAQLATASTIDKLKISQALKYLGCKNSNKDRGGPNK